ncbi:uncharacterized protein LOC132056541 isoform X1 [Lycium ferocissimum]|uniref:uncharacterized protein LOC132056541 isoform X1 n=1 Tax=Lycium ferocissimum TaxID=112874 RepID=UPI002815C3E7|nr:uncharacterized protein LOC132056541 isoform X1 [Lycium ferocissimum]XP_059304773.1 uncharacterized protein LOC132056541 isoform X1 [Lycium ferocissimum]XP_059304774.1 uncharacterized protein LOC132056541 isoform X1 [Lycium ferocissimum]
MPVAKLSIGATPAAMKADEGNDSLDTLIRQAIGKEPLFSFSRTGDGPVQWFQLLHGLEQQDNAGGWPMLTPVKLQKCEKCSREFYSPINYRRHMRLHRRALNFDKESRKYRDLLGAFWDKLSLDEIKEVVSLHDVSIKDLSGSSLVEDLAMSMRKPAVWTLPQDYYRAGLALLELIQAIPSKLAITSQELFSILDDASERTFLCAGTAESVQKYVFDGDASKKGPELKNLVACTSFLFEQKLVKAWFADKDAEALRCQKLLFEEEEAAQKKQAELLERKKLKKLRQKEQRAREQSNWERGDLEVPADSFDGPMAESSILSATVSDSYSSTPEVSDDLSSCLELVQLSNNEDIDIEAQLNLSHQHLDLVEIQDVEPPPVSANSRRQFPRTQWQVPKSQRMGRNGFHNSQNHQVQKLEPMQKHAVFKDRGAPVNSSKIWTRKVRVQNGERSRPEPQKEAMDQNPSNCEVMIGSISVPMKNSNTHGQGNCPAVERDNLDSTEPGMPNKCNLVVKPAKQDALQGGSNGAAVKLRRPVGRHGSGQHPEEPVITGKLDNQTSSTENSLPSCSMDNPIGKQVSDGNVNQGLGFCSISARAFLSQRWKEAISGDHVTLVLSNDSEVSGHPDAQNGSSEAALASDDQDHGILVKADNQQANTGVFNLSSHGNSKHKFRQKPDRSTKTRLAQDAVILSCAVLTADRVLSSSENK